MKEQIKILHIAYAHRMNDIRIVQKECMSLVQAGYEVFYATSANESEQEPEGIHFIPLKGKNDSLLCNYVINKELRKEYCEIIERIKPQIIHIHEYGISYLVKYIKKKYRDITVIYDAHEDNANSSFENDVVEYGKFVARVLVGLRGYKEHQACRYADAVIAATPHIEELLRPYVRDIVTVKNYPIINAVPIEKREGGGNIACYVGGLTRVRGITTLVESCTELSGKLYLAGPVADEYICALMNDYKETYNDKWFYKGNLSRVEVDELYSMCNVGVCIFKEARNHDQALPTKLFEYMRAGMPIVISNFPLWKDIVETDKCGFCVDANNPEEIIEKINYLFSNSQEAAMMGENGRKAVLEKYNWNIEEKKLLQIYRDVLSLTY